MPELIYASVCWHSQAHWLKYQIAIYGHISISYAISAKSVNYDAPGDLVLMIEPLIQLLLTMRSMTSLWGGSWPLMLTSISIAKFIG